MHPTVVELRDVSLTYAGPPAVTALRLATLQVARGDYVAIVGPSGSGKSTLLNIIGLLDRPTDGEYLLDGLDTSACSEAEVTALRGDRIGFVFQAFHLLPHRTAVENVTLASVYTSGRIRWRNRRSALAARQADAAALLQQVGLAHRMWALPSTMSGGEAQRVAIARALVNRPSLLLCDEPTGNLDSETANSVLNLLEDLNRDGITIIVITHDSSVAARTRRTVEIRDGVLRELSVV